MSCANALRTRRAARRPAGRPSGAACCGSSSRCEVIMTSVGTIRRSMLIAIAVLGAAAGARAQTVDDLFDGGAIQQLDLFMNSRDLRDLRARFDQDTYYTADL